ncbi:hypothetical protein C5167_005233 [Papaver somniferum]|uniref:B box-type domain-containing protein n=1 Tax=Papaver somniferum TaxID=3469 RepID=A0A4Y7JE64_PAPSO|nr:uncharacterized protein LOC113273786 [Papaver somniferum]RZC57935.1 hypothetical protein C5167_005233 [Papaver somniferum]
MVGYAIYLKKRKEKMDEWMQQLLKSRFFGVCHDHKDSKKNEINFFCIECHQCLCQHCISSPSSHCLHQQTLQIRRYVYQDVVRISDMQKHIDCSKVQTYVLNNAKVIFLNSRPNVKPPKLSSAYCKVCDRCLADNNQYCSIACKISVRPEKSNDEFHCYSYPVSQFNDIHLDESKRCSSSSGSGESDDLNEDSNGDSGEDSSVTFGSTGSLKPKKQMHKRKGVPHRAPLC